MPQLPRVGDLFGRYRIDAQIGQGGMGVVFRATDTVVERTVALKVVSAALGDSGEFRARFEREAAVLARLDSPHVIAIYDYGSEQGCPYIATQYVGGGDLGHQLHERGPMPPALALRVVAQVADALHDAHRSGVVHRDVKPTNVLLRDAAHDDLHAYLCDFGIARTTTNGLTAPGAVAGTWSYLSPECGRGAPGSVSSDVYAVGCLLWATLTGSPPYRGSDVEVAVGHQRAAVPQLEPRDEQARRINEILSRSLAKDPAERYHDADRLRLDLIATLALPGAGPGSLVKPSARSAQPPPAVTTLPTSSLPASLPVSAPASLPVSAPPASAVFADPVGPPPGRPPDSRPGSFGTPLPVGSLPPYLPPTGPPAGQPRGLAAGQPPKTRTRIRVLAAGVAVLAVAVGVALGVDRLGPSDSTSGPTAGSTAGPTAGSTGGSANEPSATPPAEGNPGAAPDDSTLGSSGPVRLDEGGPITGDRDGDGFGDLVIDYHHSEVRKGESTSMTDVTSWRSDGADLIQGDTSRDDKSKAYEQRVDGDFDGDERADVLWVLSYPDKARRLRVRGELSGGTAIDDWATKQSPTAFVSAGDLDGDGADDLVLMYYRDYTEPLAFAAVLIDGEQVRDAQPLLDSTATYERASFAVGDFDGDEVADLAELRTIEQQAPYRVRMTLWTGTAEGGRLERSTERTFATTGFKPELLAADVDGDERAEIVLVAGGKLDILDLRGGRLRGPTTGGDLGQGDPMAAYGVADVDGNGLDDVVGVLQVGGSRAHLVAAIAENGRFAVSRWAVWKQRFTTSKYFEYFTITGGGTLQ